LTGLDAGPPAGAGEFCDPAVDGADGSEEDPDAAGDPDALLAPSALTTPAADKDTGLGTG
jgi:hypothetical protein